MITGIIFFSMNLITNETYVGQTTVKFDRNDPWKDHFGDNTYYGSGVNISKAIKKYKTKNFVRHTIETVEGQENLNNRESYWIQQLKPTYNKRTKCNGPGVCSEETKRLISKGNKGKHHKPHKPHKNKKDLNKEWIIEQIRNKKTLKEISNHFNKGINIKEICGKHYYQLFKEFCPEEYHQKMMRGHQHIILDKEELFNLIDKGYSLKELTNHYKRDRCVIKYNIRTYWGVNYSQIKKTKRRKIMKHIMISDETHNRLKAYCKKYGYKLNDKADKILSEVIDLVKDREAEGIVWIEKK